MLVCPHSTNLTSTRPLGTRVLTAFPAGEALNLHACPAQRTVGSTPGLQLSVIPCLPCWYRFFDSVSPGCVTCQSSPPTPGRLHVCELEVEQSEHCPGEPAVSLTSHTTSLPLCPEEAPSLALDPTVLTLPSVPPFILSLLGIARAFFWGILAPPPP